VSVPKNNGRKSSPKAALVVSGMMHVVHGGDHSPSLSFHFALFRLVAG